MEKNSVTKNLIRNYLLGDLAKEDLQMVEQRIMTDRAWFELLGPYEDELIEDYLDRNLSRHEQERFESYFLSTPQRQERLRFARALNRYAIEQALHATEPEDGQMFFSRSARRPAVFPRPQQTYRRLPLAGAMLAAVIGLALLVISRIIPFHNPATLSALLSDHPANQMQASVTPSEVQNPVELEPGQYREVGQVAVIELTSRATEGLLKLRLTEIQGEVFQPVLQTAEGTEIATLDQLKARSLPDGRVVLVRFPAGRISGNVTYRLQLNAVDQQGHLEEVGRYYFKIVRR